MEPERRNQADGKEMDGAQRKKAEKEQKRRKKKN